LYDDFYNSVKSKFQEKKPFTDWENDADLIDDLINFQSKAKINFISSQDLDSPRFLKYSLPSLIELSRGVDHLNSWQKKKVGITQKLKMLHK
jgi:hypothetical protein